MIELSLEKPVTGEDAASLEIEPDFDSSFDPPYWVWFSFNTEDEPSFKLTYEEAGSVYNRLGWALDHRPDQAW